MRLRTCAGFELECSVVRAQVRSALAYMRSRVARVMIVQTLALSGLESTRRIVITLLLHLCRPQ